MTKDKKTTSHEEQEENVYEQTKLINYDTKEFNMLYVLRLISTNRITYKNNPVGLSSFINCKWNNSQQSKFIEEIILRKPLLLDVNLLDLGKNEDVYELIHFEDVEKLKAIYMFLNGFLRLQDLIWLNSLNALTFPELASSIRRKLENRYFRVTVYFYKRYLIYNADYKLIQMFDKLDRLSKQDLSLKFLDIRDDPSNPIIQKLIEIHQGKKIAGIFPNKTSDYNIRSSGSTRIKIVASNIKWDVDEQEDLDRLPQHVEYMIIREDYFEYSGEEFENKVTELVSDKLSDDYGFCHNGFAIHLEKENYQF